MGVDEGDQHRLPPQRAKLTGWPSESLRRSGGAGLAGWTVVPAKFAADVVELVSPPPPQPAASAAARPRPASAKLSRLGFMPRP